MPAPAEGSPAPAGRTARHAHVARRRSGSIAHSGERALEPGAGTNDTPRARGIPTGKATDDASSATPPPAWADATIYTIGHSTRPQAELIDLLQEYGVATLVDVRTMPRSRRNPQFNTEELASALPRAGIAYAHLPKLGGLRRGLGDASPNTGWRNASFRAYADYMQSPEFAEGLEELRRLTAAGPVALMCAEAVPWRCHRSLIADALFVRGVVAQDIESRTRTRPHTLTPFARVEGENITYPAAPSAAAGGDHSAAANAALEDTGDE